MRSFFFHPIVSSNRKKKTVAQRATVAAIQDVDPVTGHTRFRFGMSICSPRDQFVKKYGRAASEGKAVSNNPQLTVLTTSKFEGEKGYTSFFLENAINLLHEHGFNVAPKPEKHVLA